MTASLTPIHWPRYLRRLLGGNRVSPQIDVRLLHVPISQPGIDIAPLLDIDEVLRSAQQRALADALRWAKATLLRCASDSLVRPAPMSAQSSRSLG